MSVKMWTTEERYRSYKEWDETYISSIKEKINNSIWRLGYHIQPVTGLLNDPNGFSFFNKKWHIFYQSYPMGSVHGIKSWFHLTSSNLVDWKEEGAKLLPDSIYDSHGVYSGSALPINDLLFIAYTGNVRDKNWLRHSYQLGAWMDKNGVVKKIATPLLNLQPKGYSNEFRDPQIFRYNDDYLMVIGAQNEEKEGKILTYRSADLISWQFLGELNFTNQLMGFMVECPNLLLDEQFALLIFCPQGLNTEVCSYQNIYPNTYVIADSYDLKSNSLLNASSLKNIDEGFDVYATQVFRAPDDRLLSISWVGLPEINYPTDCECWAHCLSIVKELVIKENRLYQYPVEEMKQIRSKNRILIHKKSGSFYDIHSNRYELKLSFEENSHGIIKLCTNKEQDNGLIIYFDSKNGKITIDRSHLDFVFGEQYGMTRSFSIERNVLELQIFVDSSIVEIFVNGGESVASMRIFPNSDKTGINLISNGEYKGILWHLRDTNN